MAETLIFQIEIDGGKSVQTLAELKAEIKRLKDEFSSAKMGTPEFVQLGQTIQRVETEAKNLTKSFKEQNNLIPGSIGAIRQELKQFQQELENSVPGTKSFNAALLEVGKRKNELLELKQAIKLSSGDSEQTIKALAGAAQGIAGAMTIASSSVALFTDDNKELAEAVQKAQLAMSILQGFESVAGSKDSANIVRRILFFKDYKKTLDDSTNSVKGQTVAIEGQDTVQKAATVSANTLKVALSTIGIGLLVTAISELIQNWDKVKATFSSTLPIFTAIGNWVDEVKQRFVGAFYAIGESIKPVGTFIYDYFTTPFQVAYQSAQILFKILQNPLSLDNLKNGVKEFGNLFSTTKDKLTNDLNNIQKKFNEGFDYGTGIEKQRQANAAKKELLEKEIKDLEQSVQFIKEGSLKRLEVEKDIIQKKLSISEKGSEDYKKLQVDLFKKEEEIKDKNVEIQKKNIDDREKQIADYEKKIKEKYAAQSTIINVTAQVQVNQGSNPGDIEAVRDIELTKNKLAELEERKSLYEIYKKDVTQILSDISNSEQILIQQNKKLVESLKTQEFNQDNSNLSSYLKEREELINSNYQSELTALNAKNLSAEQFESEFKKIQEQRDIDLTNLKKEELQKQLQNAKDYGQPIADLNKQIADLNVKTTEDEIARKIELEKQFSAKKLELTQELAQKTKELEEQAISAGFEFIKLSFEKSNNEKISSLDANLQRENQLIDDNLKKGIITQEQADKQKKANQEKTEKEKRKIVRETAIIERTLNVFKIAVDTARTVHTIQSQALALAANPITAPLAIFAESLIPFEIASAAIQTGVMLAQPLPPAKDGKVIGSIPQSSPLSKTDQPIYIDMGNGNTTLFDPKGQNKAIRTSSTGNPIIDIGGRYTDDVLAVNDQNQPVARVNKGEAIMTAGAVQKFAPILSQLNEMGGGVKFPGFAAGTILNNTYTSNSTSSTSLMDVSKLEVLLSEIKEEVSKPQRSYVVETDITEVQNRVNTIKQRATF